MAQSSLTKLLDKGDSDKVRIGYTDKLSAYADVMKSMGSVYGQAAIAEYVDKVVDVDSGVEFATTATTSTSALGSFELNEERADADGLFQSNQMAAVLVYPFLTFPYKGTDNTVRGLSFIDCEQTASGQTLSGKRLTTPSTFDKATLDACHTDNPNDFVVGCGINLSGTFAQTYIQRFYSGKLELNHLLLLAKKQYLYGEIFFPVESGQSKVMVVPVIADIDGTPQLGQIDEFGIPQLTYYKCYIPTPILTLNGFDASFKVADTLGNVIETPAYGNDAIYSYVKGTISGYSPQIMKEYVSNHGGSLEMNTAQVIQWPGMVEGNQVYGRFRFCVPTSYESEAREIIGEKAPQELFGLSDNTISTGIVTGANSSRNYGSADGLVYFPEEEYRAKGITTSMYYAAMKYVFWSENCSTIPNYDRVDCGWKGGSQWTINKVTLEVVNHKGWENDGINLGFYSIGVSWGNLHSMLTKHYLKDPEANPAYVAKWRAIVDAKSIPDSHNANRMFMKENKEFFHKIGSLWVQTVKDDPAICRAQWKEWWTYAGKTACDIWVNKGYKSLFALAIILELLNWRPASRNSFVEAGNDERAALLVAVNKWKEKKGDAGYKMYNNINDQYNDHKNDLKGVIVNGKPMP